jgi:hypothetical protein
MRPEPFGFAGAHADQPATLLHFASSCAGDVQFVDKTA